VAPGEQERLTEESDFSTKQLYIDLADESFREAAELLDARLFGQESRQK
jgi:hypothetical protein